MGKYVAAALMIVAATGPAAALDIGGGGKVGGLGVGAGVSVGSQGVSAGVGASVGGSGASVGASTGTGGVSVGASASVGGASIGATTNAGTGSVGAGASTGDTAGSTSAGVSTGAGTATSGTATPDNLSVFSAKSATTAISLPSILKPSSKGGGEFGRSKAGYPFAPLVSLKAKPGTPPKVVSACRAAIVSAATPLGAVRVSAVSAGPMRQRNAGLAAPIEVRINYALRSGVQVRQAKVLCRLDAAGKVIAVT